jgi:hypothetical protein
VYVASSKSIVAIEAPTLTKHEPATDMSDKDMVYEAARKGEKETIEQALAAGLTPNSANEKGDTLVA